MILTFERLCCEEDYLGGGRLNFAFLLLVLFVGSGVDNQLFTPPAGVCVHKHTCPKISEYQISASNPVTTHQ